MIFDIDISKLSKRKENITTNRLTMSDREMVWNSLPGLEDYLKYKLVSKLSNEEGTEKEREKRIKEYRKNKRSHSKYSNEVRSFENIICNFVVFVYECQLQHT
jgi:hypothetical protein